MDIQAIESIQEMATKMVSGLGAKSYDERLEILDLWRLSKRRKMFDLIQTYKIVHGIGKIDCSIEFVGERSINARITRNQADAMNLKRKHSRLEIRKHFFTNRVVDDWNRLPSDIKNSNNVNNFKKKLVMWMKDRE